MWTGRSHGFAGYTFGYATFPTYREPISVPTPPGGYHTACSLGVVPAADGCPRIRGAAQGVCTRVEPAASARMLCFSPMAVATPIITWAAAGAFSLKTTSAALGIEPDNTCRCDDE